MPEFTYYVEDAEVKVRPSIWDNAIGWDEALDESIRKWEFVVSVLMLGTKIVSCGDAETCALCAIVGDADHGEWCIGCPVENTTHDYQCIGTPYQTFIHAKVGSPKQLEAAEAELKFLKEIRDGIQGSK